MKKYLLHILFACVLAVVSPSLQAQENGGDFNSTIEQGDKYFAEGDYINAKASYQYALKIKPEDEYATKRLKESLDLIKLQQEKSRQFTLRIMTADDLYNQERYEEALTEYRKGLEIIADDEYALGRVSEIEEILGNREKNEQEYLKNVALGDKAFSEKKYLQATDHYKQALAIRPGDNTLKDKIAEADQLYEQNQAQLDEYNTALSKAEQFINRKSYDGAIEQLQKAIELKPSEQEPQIRLAAVREMKKEYDAYMAIVEQGDSFYMNKDFGKAKEKYEEALRLRPDDDYVQNLLDRTNIAIADAESLKDADFEEALAMAEKFFSQEEYDMAMEEYKKALRLKPDQAYIKEKIDEINQIVSLRQTQQQAYEQAVARGDKLFQEENYQDALAEYKKANELKPLEPYPKVKMEEVSDLMADLKSKRETYSSLITGADKLFFADDYFEAREQYQRALDMFPSEKYPQDQITMINEIIGLRDKYMKALTRADQLFAEEDYSGALLEYRNAAEINPDELYPAEKIEEIEVIIAEQQRVQELEDQYQAAIVEADRYFENRQYDRALAAYDKASGIKPKEEYPKVKIENIRTLKEEAAFNNRFDSVMTAGERQVGAGELEVALATFDRALEMKPGSTDARQQKDKVNGLILQREQQAELAAEYREIIAEADQFRDGQNYEQALSAYSRASDLMPEESYPGEQIAAINEILASQAALEQLERDYQKALTEGDNRLAEGELNAALSAYAQALELKPGEEYPQQQIAEINTRLEAIALQNEKAKEYQETVAAADELFKKGDYTGAIAKYEEASGLDPDQEYPVKKAEEARSILDDIAAQKALDEQYDQIMANATALMEDQKYQESLARYNEALSLKPDEQLPKDKISEIRAIISQQEQAAALEKEYDEILSGADRSFDFGEYDKALDAYRRAAEIKPEEEYPRQRIVLVEEELAKIARQKEIDSTYQQAIFFADKHFNEGEYEAAAREYKVANSIKPSETYPTERLEDIEEIISQRERQAEINRKYNEVIAIADVLFKEEKYREALTSYQEAKGIKPDNPYPPSMIVEVKKKMEEQTEEIQRAYDLAITRADNFYNEEKWDMAKLHYETALQLIPESDYANERLKVVNDNIQMKRRAAQEDYDKAIADADKFYAAKIYDDAIQAYRKAANIKQDEEYPTAMIRRIMKLLSERAIVGLNKEPLVIEDRTTHKFDFVPVPVQDRKGNYMFFKAKNLSGSEYKLIVSFGKGGAKNGGFVVRIPETKSEEEFIIRISAQYKWFSDDNNWVTMYPEGGDIQVSQVQISHSD